MVRMSIHRALAELKLYDSKIYNKINEFKPVGFQISDKLINNNVGLEDFKRKAEADFQSIKDMINNKNKLKNAIVKSNAETEVTIAGVTMKVADAINFKALNEYNKLLINSLKMSLNQNISIVNKHNEKVEEAAQKTIEQAYGKDNKNVDLIKSTFDQYQKVHAARLIDPLNAEKQIAELEAKLNAFSTEVDAVLSESNGITQIEVDL